MINGFPNDIRNVNSQEDKNPAIQLFGRRFTIEQQIMELLSEFLLVLCSKKLIGEHIEDGYFPTYERLSHWPKYRSALKYASKAKINLKLFAFLGSSRLETRHKTHRDHFQELWNKLTTKINTDSSKKKEDTLQLLSNLFLGFWGTGAQRTWCAQTFLPFAKGVLAGETIWNETIAKKNKLNFWDDILTEYNHFFSSDKHRFLARGGELLYLQLCNALRQDATKVETWLRETGRWDNLRKKEKTPEDLLSALSLAFEAFFIRTPAVLNTLADFIDTGVENATAEASDGEESERWISCGWCPEESWHESYLFAIELLRLLEANIDLLEMVEQLQMACSLQLLRNLAAQSYRYTLDNGSDGLNYHLILSNPKEGNRGNRDASICSTVEISRTIHDAIRISEIKNTINPADEDKVYREADDRYGFKLYRKIGKSIDLIVPKTGSGMRFVISTKLLRHLVLTLVPGERIMLDTFLQQMKSHHGFVLAGDSTTLENMLEIGGMLVKLSDSCSLVKNPFFEEKSCVTI